MDPSPEESPQKPRGGTSWRVTLYVFLAVQFLAVALFWLVEFFRVDVNLPFFLSYAWLGPLSFLAILLWCSESAIARPRLTRLAIRSILVAIILWAGSFILYPATRPRNTSERRADLDRAFRELAAEQKIPPPAQQPKLDIRSRHGDIFSIRYRDTSGLEQHYFVTMQQERQWVFQTSINSPKIIAPARY